MDEPRKPVTLPIEPTVGKAPQASGDKPGASRRAARRNMYGSTHKRKVSRDA